MTLTHHYLKKYFGEYIEEDKQGKLLEIKNHLIEQGKLLEIENYLIENGYEIDLEKTMKEEKKNGYDLGKITELYFKKFNSVAIVSLEFIEEEKQTVYGFSINEKGIDFDENSPFYGYRIDNSIVMRAYIDQVRLSKSIYMPNDSINNYMCNVDYSSGYLMCEASLPIDDELSEELFFDNDLGKSDNTLSKHHLVLTMMNEIATEYLKKNYDIYQSDIEEVINSNREKTIKEK